MQKSRGHEPGQERDVLDGIPGPVAAPAEHGIRPERAQQQPEGEEAPHHERPSADDRDPLVRALPGEQRRDAESEGHGEADEPEVQERWMDRH